MALALLAIGCYGASRIEVRNDFLDYAHDDTYAKRCINKIWEAYPHRGEITEVVTGRIDYTIGDFEKINEAR